MSDYPSQEEITEARRKSLTESIRSITAEEAKKLSERIFPDSSDSWRETYLTFITENAGARFYHAKTSDRFEVVYCYPNNKGIWFFENIGKGRIRAHNLELMKKIVEKL